MLLILACEKHDTVHNAITGGANSLHDVLAKIVRHLSIKQVDVEFLNLFPLPTLLANSIDTPLLTQ